MNQKNHENTDKGITRLRSAAANPAVRKMFDAIISGGIDKNVVDPDYINNNVEFLKDELDCVCRVMTREKITAFKNNINLSAANFADQFIKGLDVKDHASDSAKEVIDDVASLYDEETDDVRAIVIMSVIRNALMDALDTRTVVKSAANESVIVEVVDPKGNNIPTKDNTETRAEEPPIETTGTVIDDGNPVDDNADLISKLKNNKFLCALMKAMENDDCIQDIIDIQNNRDIFKNPEVMQEFMKDIPTNAIENMAKVDSMTTRTPVVGDKPVPGTTYALVKPQSARETSNVVVSNKPAKVNNCTNRTFDQILVCAASAPCTLR